MPREIHTISPRKTVVPMAFYFERLTLFAALFYFIFLNKLVILVVASSGSENDHV